MGSPSLCFHLQSIYVWGSKSQFLAGNNQSHWVFLSILPTSFGWRVYAIVHLSDYCSGVFIIPMFSWVFVCLSDNFSFLSYFNVFFCVQLILSQTWKSLSAIISSSLFSTPFFSLLRLPPCITLSLNSTYTSVFNFMSQTW